MQQHYYFGALLYIILYMLTMNLIAERFTLDWINERNMICRSIQESKNHSSVCERLVSPKQEVYNNKLSIIIKIGLVNI